MRPKSLASYTLSQPERDPQCPHIQLAPSALELRPDIVLLSPLSALFHHALDRFGITGSVGQCRTMSACTIPDNEDHYRYTSERWLWDEDKQLRERYKRFNVSELKSIAAKSIGTQTCMSISKLAEGGFKKVFRLVMDDGTIVIARIPNYNAGPPFKTTASEVATMDFVRWVVHRNFEVPGLI